MTFSLQWQNNRAALESSGVRIIEALKKGTNITANPGESPPLAPDIANRCFQQLAHSYEEEYGGFRDAPKFPSPGKFLVILGNILKLFPSSICWDVFAITSRKVQEIQWGKKYLAPGLYTL